MHCEGLLGGRAGETRSRLLAEEVPEAEATNQSPQAMSLEAIGQRAFNPEARAQSPQAMSPEARTQRAPASEACVRPTSGGQKTRWRKKAPFRWTKATRWTTRRGGDMEQREGQRCPAALCPDAHRHVFHARGEGWSRCLGCASAKTCCMHMSPSLGYVISWVCYLHQHQRRHRHHHNNTHTSTPHQV